MSKRKEGTPEEELREFAQRMIEDVEDLDYTGSADDWQEFVSSKLSDGGTLAQLSALEEKRLDVWQTQFTAGFQQEAYERPWGVQKVFREAATGRFIARASANEMLQKVLPRMKK
jgi:hypothetical protein